MSVKSGDAAPKGKIVKGSWVVGDNPRMIYFPYVQPQRSYSIALRAGLPGIEKATLVSSSHCEVSTEAMPPSFYFASRGVVLPAGQNGGLPVATVNVPEVDVQFLRVEPDRVPELFDSVLGLGRSASSSDDDGVDYDGEDGWRYSDNRSLKGSVSNWDLDRLNTLTTSVYQGRFVTDDKPNRRHVTFLPVEGIKELQEPGIYIAVMSQPGRFRYEYRSAISTSATSACTPAATATASKPIPSRSRAAAISGAVFELVDGAGKSLAKAAADGQGHVRFEGSFTNARLIRASRDKEMTVLALAEPALDLSEFDIGGHVSRPNNLFVYAGRNLYRPGETFHVGAAARPDGRVMPPSPLTATIKRPDGRVVQTTLWQPAKDLQGYVERAIDLPPDAQTGTWLLELRVDPASRAPDASWKFRSRNSCPSA